MRIARRDGYTLMEVMIVTGILSSVIVLTLDFMAQSTDQVAVITEETWLQRQIQLTIDDVIAEIREASADHVCLYRWTDPPGGKIVQPDGSQVNSTQVAICFPTPRNQSEDFIFTTGSGASLEVSSEPVWQGIKVIAYYDKELWEYADYNWHIYNDANPLRISTITDTTITLTDGTTFNRAGVTTAKQTARSVMANLAQLEVPNFASGYQASTLPMQLQIVAQTAVAGGTLNQGVILITASMLTEVLTRNKN